MEFNFKFKLLVFFFLLKLVSCATTDLDETGFESQEEENKRVLNDTYIVEEQKKIKDYQPDSAKLKTITMDVKKTSSIKNKNKKNSTNTSKLAKVSSELNNKLSNSNQWKDQDLKSQKLWNQFNPSFINIGEKHILQASYTGINAASIVIEVRPQIRYQSQDVYHFQAKAKTADFYKWIYSLNDIVDSLVDKQNFISWKYSLIQKEKNKDIEDVQFYDRNSLNAYSYYKKSKSGNVSEEKKQNEIPYYGVDYFSSLFFVRGLPLNEKDHYIFPTTTRSETWLMSVKVVAKEKIKLGIGEFSTIKLELMTKYTGDLAKKGPIDIWLSDDDKRILLMAKAVVNIGSIKLELSEYYRDGKLLYGNK